MPDLNPVLTPGQIAEKLEEISGDAGNSLDGAERDAIAEAASLLRDQDWRPTHRHNGRGTAYQFIGTALLQWSPQLGDMDPVTIYRDEHGQTWVRGSNEFNDGRFSPLPPPPAGGDGP